MFGPKCNFVAVTKKGGGKGREKEEIPTRKTPMLLLCASADVLCAVCVVFQENRGPSAGSSEVLAVPHVRQNIRTEVLW